MATHRLVSGLPSLLPLLPPSPAPSCTPCVEGWQRAAPHSSSLAPSPGAAYAFCVWGCLAHVRNPCAAPSAVFSLVSRLTPVTPRGVWEFHPSTHQFFDSRDVNFDALLHFYMLSPPKFPASPSSPLPHSLSSSYSCSFGTPTPHASCPVLYVFDYPSSFRSTGAAVEEAGARGPRAGVTGTGGAGPRGVGAGDARFGGDDTRGTGTRGVGSGGAAAGGASSWCVAAAAPAPVVPRHLTRLQLLWQQQQ
ncbi:unnamed protein product [Closterium sp. NIES-54]